MSRSAQIGVRFVALEDQSRKIPFGGNQGDVADRAAFYAWALSALNLIRASFGEDSPHFRVFSDQLSQITNTYVDRRHAEAFRGLFLAAKSDFESGISFDVERVTTGEIFGDFIAAAKVALFEGNHTVAAVLACAALEDALKRYASASGLEVEGRTMEEVVNGLKSKGLVAGPQKALLSAFPRIRNHAMHADWQKITPQDAGSVIGFVEQFLQTHFS